MSLERTIRQFKQVYPRWFDCEHSDSDSFWKAVTKNGKRAFCLDDPADIGYYLAKGRGSKKVEVYKDTNYLYAREIPDSSGE
jgi:hypothetical protein